MSTQTIEALDLWMGNFYSQAQPTITVHSEVYSSDDKPQGEPLVRPTGRRIGFLPWSSETDDTSDSA